MNDFKTWKQRLTFYSLHLFIFSLILSCNQVQDKSRKDVQEEKKISIAIPVFNQDSAYSFVKAQVDFGPRVPGTKAHKRCADYLFGKLKSWLPNKQIQTGRAQTFDGSLFPVLNIIGSFKPETNNRILLCAHWDSRPYADHDPDPANHRYPIDGANDGASGVGVLLEIARQISLSKPEIGVDIIFFDLEDYGPPQDKQSGSAENWWGLGSQYWSNNPHKGSYFARYGILLDMVGASHAVFPMEGISMQYAHPVQKKVWDIANRIGFSAYFIYEPGGSITDDHYYINTIAHIPTIDIIHLEKYSRTGFHPAWHTTKDRLDVIDRNTLKVVGQTLLTVIYEEI